MGKPDLNDNDLEKIFEAAREEPLPTLAAAVWTISKILDDRLGELVKQGKVIEGILQDIQSAIERKD